MRYFEWPKTGIGVKTFINTVDGEEQSGTTQGGDGKGGPYLWNKMPDIISKSTPTDEIKSVGALLADIGKVLEASYTPIGSGAQTPAVALRLTDTFGYSNAIFAIEPIAGFDPEYSTPTHIRNRINRINPNLDAKLPVFLSAFDPAGLGGHTVVTDGYGYSSSSLYHHINMGWGGKFNAWYALPDIYAMYDGALGPLYASDRIIDCIYNIYTSGTGEIISGRVVDLSGSPVNGASVSIKGAIATVKTDERGIFAFAKVPSNTFYTIETTKDGQLFDSKAVKTGRSVNPNFGPNYGISYPDSQSKECGNVWAVEIKEIKTPATIFTVTFDSQGGSAVSSVTDITYGAIIPAPKSPTRSGYAFDGWYEELSYTTKWDFSADAVTTDMTLYAKWTGTDGSGSGSGGGCDAGVGVLSVLFAAGVILLRCKGK
ncbi:hypothetical protein FACS1894216_13500 [Synergistales bacterium]|nr:hypothetical protein FACS1894216_13500 [Synergistales bacterium]